MSLSMSIPPDLAGAIPLIDRFQVQDGIFLVEFGMHCINIVLCKGQLEPFWILLSSLCGHNFFLLIMPSTSYHSLKQIHFFCSQLNRKNLLSNHF